MYCESDNLDDNLTPRSPVVRKDASKGKVRVPPPPLQSKDTKTSTLECKEHGKK